MAADRARIMPSLAERAFIRLAIISFAAMWRTCRMSIQRTIYRIYIKRLDSLATFCYFAAVAWKQATASKDQTNITANGAANMNKQPSAMQLAALIDFATRCGRNWKTALNHSWETGDYDSTVDKPSLQQVRNQFGPTWLARFTLPKQYAVCREANADGKLVLSVVRLGKLHQTMELDSASYTVFYSDPNGTFERNGYTRIIKNADIYNGQNTAIVAMLREVTERSL